MTDTYDGRLDGLRSWELAVDELRQRHEGGTTQVAQIRAALLRGERLTQKDAINRWRCYRLAARIKELRDDGWVIHTDRLPVSRAAVYSLIGTGAA